MINNWTWDSDTDWRAEYFKLRGEYDRLASLHGSDAHVANMDTDWAKKFEELDREYRALEKELNKTRPAAEMWDRFKKLVAMVPHV